jgi:VRR-NUC domain
MPYPQNKTFDKYLTQEDNIQIALIRWITYQYPQAVVLHIHNESKRSRFEVWKAKKMGMQKGASDLLIFFNGKSIAIELKSDKGKVKPEQIVWQTRFKESGHSAFICRGFDEAKQVIEMSFKN